MQERIGFEEAVERILEKDPRYHRDAYFFLREALDYTVKKLGREGSSRQAQHVSGRELLEGVRLFALEQFGPMVPTVFAEWGLGQSRDVGEVVFNLIEMQVFGKSETDDRKDFEDAYDFDEAFVAPFRPRRPLPGKPMISN